MGSSNLPFGRDPRMWNSSLRFAAGVSFPPPASVWILLDGLFPPFSLFLTKLATITQTRVVASLSAPRPHHYNVHVCTPPISWCHLVLGPPGPRCNFLLSHILSLSFPFLHLVFSSILGDYTCVWVCLCPFLSVFFPFLFPIPDVSMRSR